MGAVVYFSITCLLALLQNRASAFAPNIGKGQQQVSVKGRVMCPSDPSKAHNIKVVLVDKDSGLLNPGFIDDKMGEVRTNGQGEFTIQGKARDLLGNVDPHLKIYHKCNSGRNPCDRRVSIKIPELYILSAGAAEKVMDIGVLNLEAIFKKEERACLSGK